MANLSNMDNPPIKHLFISGPPRSGTTLLQLLLSEHSRISISPETTFIQNLLIWELKQDVIIRGKLKNKLLNFIDDDAKLSTWPNFEISLFYQDLKNGDFTVVELLHRLFSSYAKGCNKTVEYIGNKKEIYCQKYGIYIKKIFPDSKFIFIVRDPRDVVASSINNLKEYDLQRAAVNCRYMGHYIDKMKKLYPNDVHIVKYENLVHRPKLETEDICKFLDLDFETKMLDFYRSNKNYNNLIGSTKNIHRNTNKPINSDLSFKWKKEKIFREHELKCIQDIALNYFRNFNYELVKSHSKNSSLLFKASCFKQIWEKTLYRKYKKYRKI